MKINLRILLQFGFTEIRQDGSLWSQNSVESLENIIFQFWIPGQIQTASSYILLQKYVTLSASDRERIPRKDTS